MSTTQVFDGDISTLSIRDVIAMATRQLRGTSKQVDRGFIIELRNYELNQLLVVELTKSKMDKGGSNLRISSSHIKQEVNSIVVSTANIEHLYVTWETSGMISFCFAGDGRYKLINVTHDNGVFITEDIDRRREPVEREMSESEKRARAKRRTFFHIGRNFDEANVHDPQKPMKSSDDPDEENDG